jgi:hypothetical protein
MADKPPRLAWFSARNVGAGSRVFLLHLQVLAPVFTPRGEYVVVRRPLIFSFVQVDFDLKFEI